MFGTKKHTNLIWQNIGLLNRENFITKQLKSGHHYLVRVPYNNSDYSILGRFFVFSAPQS